MDNLFDLLKKKYIPGEAILSSILDGLIIVDSAKSFVYWNEAAKNILCDEPDATEPKNWAQRYRLFDVEKDSYLKYEELPIVKALNGEEFYDYRVVTKNYRYPEGRVISVNGQPIRNGSATVGAVLTFRDVTEQIEAERRNTTERKLYQAILDLLPAFVFIKDLEGRYVYGNKVFLETLGTQTITGKSSHDYLNKDEATMINEHDELVLKTGKAHTFEEVIFWKPEERKIYNSIRFPYWNQKGEMAGICVVAIDITSQIDSMARLESERDRLAHVSKLAAIGVLAAEIVHEIKNPITILGGNCAVIKSSIMSGDVENEFILGQLTNAERTIERMEKVVESLSNLSRDASMSENEVFTIGAVLEDVKNLTSMRTKKMKVDLRFEGTHQDAKLFGNRIQVAEVLMNLIINALDAIEKSPDPQIRVLTKATNDDVTIRVFDNGPGVPREHWDRIFEPFFTTKTVTQGSGLGLSLSRKIVSHHRGNLLYEEKDGKHCFALILPLDKIH